MVTGASLTAEELCAASGLSEIELAGLQGVHDDLHASADAEAAFGAFDVVMSGVFTDAEDGADCPVVFALGGQFETLALAIAQARTGN